MPKKSILKKDTRKIMKILADLSDDDDRDELYDSSESSSDSDSDSENEIKYKSKKIIQIIIQLLKQ